MQEDEIKDVQKALEEDLVYLEQLQALHEENARQQGPSLAGGNRSRLDSSMKKCAAVTRKLKTLSEASAQGILDDLSKVNMSKYASEAVSSVVEAPLKLKDVRAAVQVLSALNAYPDFRTLLFGRLMEELTGSAVGAAGHVQKRRVLLRLFFGCVQAGIFPASDVRYITLDKIFRSVSSVSGTTIAGAAARTGRTAGLTLDTPSGLEASLQSLALVNAFLKAGGPGLYPRVCGYKNEMRLRELAKGSATTPPDATAEACVEEIEKINGMKLALWALPEGDEQKLRMKVQAYVEGAVKALDAWYKQVVQTKKRNDVAIQSRGDISEKRHQEYKEMREALDAFQKAVGTLAGTLRVRLPEYVVEEDVEAEEKGGSVHLVEPTRIFEDAEERALYMALPQLAEVVPSTLLGVAGGDDADGEASDGGGDVDMDMIAEATDMDMEMDLKASEHADQADQELEGGRLGEPGPEEDQPASTSSLSELIGRLSECVTMEECDAFSVQYCYVGGKKASSQRALALALSRPPHGAIQLLPFYSRVIASLAPFFPIIKEEILSKLQRQFHGLKNVLDISMDTLEPRLRNASYIAELVKFGVYPPGKAFMQLRSLFDDFSRQNIDTACCLVQNCGNYLYRRPDTSERMVNMMNIMTKLKDAKNLDSRHEELIAQAKATMYGIETKVQRKVRSPVHEFVRYQVYSLLDAGTVTEVTDNLRRIDWKQDSEYVRKKILGAVRKGKESQLAPLARLVLELQRYDKQFGIDVVDEVVEELFCGMDHPEVSHYHRRLSMARFLGSLANVKMPGVDSDMLIDMMRTFMSYSTSGPTSAISEGASSAIHTSASHSVGSDEILEPMFRVRLIVALTTEAKQLYVRRSRSRGNKHRGIELVVKQRRALLHLVLPQLEEFIMRHNRAEDRDRVGSLASHSFSALVDVLYEICKLGTRVTPANHDEAVQNVAAAMKRYGVVPGSGGRADDDVDDEDDDDDGDGDDGDDVEANDLEGVSEDSDDDEDDEDESDDEATNRAQGPSEEDLLFERELAMALGASVTAAASAGARRSLAPPGISRRGTDDADDGRTSRLAFKVVTKRGCREDKSKRVVHIPVSDSLVERVAKKKEAEAEEKAALKRIVLASSDL